MTTFKILDSGINAHYETCIDTQDCSTCNKHRYKMALVEELSTTNDIYECIYMIDNTMISGEFDYGTRGLDHNALLINGKTWVDVLNMGTLIVPENETYISDYPISELESIGYSRLPLNDNHVMGYQ